jgi:hypothetical protein
MPKLELLRNLSFGARVAEEETAELAKYFVETDQWNRIFRGEIDIIQGDKGAGKSAIYSLLVATRNYVKRWFYPKSVEGSFAFDVSTGLPTLSGKITPSEPGAELRSKGYLSVDSLLGLANRALGSSGYRVWVLLDRLDVAFVESNELEKNALRALFRVYRDFGSFDRITLKIFLRSDIWRRIVEGGFREASHITRVAILDWKPPALLNLIVRRILSNDPLVDEYKIDRADVLGDFDKQQKIFYRLFPQQVEQGSKKRQTLEWMISRTADGTDKTAPRELIHLLNTVREKRLSALNVERRQR